MPTYPELAGCRAQAQPHVSIGLPVRNAEGTLAMALASVLLQTFEDWELLVLDDRSQDCSSRIARRIAEVDPRVRVLEASGASGLVPRLNQALAAARGEFFARMDADDVAFPRRLERQLEFLDMNLSVDVVGTSMLVFRDEGIARGIRSAPTSHGDICARPNSGFKLFHPTWIGRTEWFRTYGYRAYARHWEDQELLLRAFRDSQFANLAQPLVGYRENRIRLGRMAGARFKFAATVMSQRAGEGRMGQAMAVLIEQAGKTVAEATLAILGLESLLVHRAGRAPSDSLAEWRDIWRATLSRSRQLTAAPVSTGQRSARGEAPEG